MLPELAQCPSKQRAWLPFQKSVLVTDNPLIKGANDKQDHQTVIWHNLQEELRKVALQTFV